MLEDRDYMRQPANDDESPLARVLDTQNWSWTVIYLVVNGLVFLAQCLCSQMPLTFGVHPYNPFVDKYLCLSLEGIKNGYLWQLVTYQFLHGSLMHIVLNAWAIYVFGRIIEETRGPRHFLGIALSSGVVGGLFQVVAAQLWPAWFDGPTLGASAGAFGLVAAFATLHPEHELSMLIYFVIPVRMKARTLLLVSAGLAIVGLLFPQSLFGGNVANAAHLGGIVAGVYYVRKIILGRWFHSRRVVPVVMSHPTVTYTAAAPVFSMGKTNAAAVELSAEELLHTQVDPILDKISAHGLHSLTAHEREILELASGKLAKR